MYPLYLFRRDRCVHIATTLWIIWWGLIIYIAENKVKRYFLILLFLPISSCMKSASKEYRNKSSRRGKHILQNIVKDIHSICTATVLLIHRNEKFPNGKLNIFLCFWQSMITRRLSHMELDLLIRQGHLRSSLFVWFCSCCSVFNCLLFVFLPCHRQFCVCIRLTICLVASKSLDLEVI